MSLVAHKYMPSEMSEAELEATFAARGHTVDYLVKMLRDQMRSGTLSSFIISGPRGAGKSTVLRMVALRLKQDAALNAAWLPVLFPEEQFNITSLRDLLAATLKVLSSQDAPSARTWLDQVEAEPNDEQSLQLAVTGLRKITQALKRRLVLFIENLNLLFEKGFTDQEKGAFRRLLMTDPFMMVVGSAVHVFKALQSYDEAFFNYFGEVPLDRLTAEQVFQLLTLRAQYDGNERFLREFPQNQTKVRAIVHLSGGNPRLILMLYELLSQKRVTSVVQQLGRLVDELTPLLKHEMESLPPQQRKIIHALMERGGTAQPADLAAPTRLKLNTITEQLRRLKQAQVLTVLGGGKGRPAFYTVPDQLFAIWYQMRYLRQNRRRIEVFVEVLRTWFEAEERFETLRRFQARTEDASPAALRDAATTAEYFAATLVGTVYEEQAREMSLRHWLRTGDLRETALAYAEFLPMKADSALLNDAQAYTSLGHWSLEHEDSRTANAAFAEAAKELVNSGLAKGMAGDLSGALADFTAALELPGAPKELLANALNNRGVAKGKAGDLPGALADFAAVLELPGAPKEEVAQALVNRGVAKDKAGDLPGEIADYTAAVELAGAPKKLLAKALFNRGMAKGMVGDLPGQMADYTAVVELAGAPKEQVAMALVNRGVAKGKAGDLPGALADFNAIVELPGAPKELVTQALFNRGMAKGMVGDLPGQMANYTAVVELAGAPKEQVAMALVYRGVAKGMVGDLPGEMADYTAVVKLAGAPKEQVAMALVYRGVAKGKAGDLPGEIADYTAVVELAGAPKELVAMALVYRGMIKGNAGDLPGEMADYTAVVDSAGASQEQVAQALFNRGVAKGKARDVPGSLDDFNAIVELPGASQGQVAQALVNRGVAKTKAGDLQGALTDWERVLRMNKADTNAWIAAVGGLFGLHWLAGRREDAGQALELFKQRIEARSDSDKSLAMVGLLSRLATPALREAWPLAWRLLAKGQPPAVEEALELLKPVAEVLVGAEVSSLNALSPERREFAQRILARFDASAQYHGESTPHDLSPSPKHTKLAS